MKKYNPNIHHRRSIRLKGYDYSQAGFFFITICVKYKECLFGEIINHELILNDAGKMVSTQWKELPQRFTNIQIHASIVMPNHFHAILEIVGATLVVAQNNMDTRNDMDDRNINVNCKQQKGQPQGNTPAKKKKTLGDMVGAFQSITTDEYIHGVKNNNWQPFAGKLWQRNYWEHIIRTEQAFFNISEYIINNPSTWDNDKLNPSNTESNR